MSRYAATLSVCLVGVLMWGCTHETGTPTAGGGGTEVASTTTSEARGATPPGQTPPAPSVTPKSGIDARSVVDVVKEEVKGGESEKGPTPENFLWLLPDERLIQDEPLTVTPPAGLQELAPVTIVPAANPLTRAKYELGRQLYFDPRLSKDGTVSCATCHNPEKGWTDQMPVSIGIGGQTGSRSAPTVLNTAYGRTMFWDGRAPSLEGQAQGPIQNKIEMGDQSYKEIVLRLRKIKDYSDQFKKAFGTDVTLDGIAKAIATFERAAALTGNSPYDRYNGGDNKALNESQKRGLVLFGLTLNTDDGFKPNVVQKKAGCTSCHVGFNFTDENFHNLGVGWDEKARKFADPGRFGVTPVGGKNLTDLGSFKTPTIRDVTRTAPYMHDGSEKTLEAVIDFYDRGGNANPWLDKDIKQLKLTAQEKKDLVEFMKALTGESPAIDLPSLPSGPDGKVPDPRAALNPPRVSAAALGPIHPGAIR